MKVLVIRFSSLGDVVLASSLLDPLYNLNIQVDFLTFKPFGQLFKYDYRINNLIEIEKEKLKSFKQIKDFSTKLKNEDYDYILDIHSNLRTFLISYLSKIKTYRYNKNSLKRRLFIYKPLRKFIKNNNFNVVYSYLDILKNIKNDDYSKYRPKLILNKEDFKGLKSLPLKFIAIGTGAKYKSKVYPYYNKVSELLLEKGFNVVLVGSNEDKKLDKNLYPKEVVDLRGKLTLRQSLAVLSKALGTISNDSAVAHMTRAVKKPVLMIYGATHPFFGFAPLKDEGDFILKNIECQPCDLHGKKDCRLGTLECLDIPPEVVVNRFLNLIGNKEKNI